MSDHEHYTIGQLADEFGVTTRAIRFYEDKGLLNPERRGRTRLYGAGDRVRLMLILRGKRLGFSLDECQEVFELYDPGHGNVTQLERMLEKIEEKREALRQQERDIAHMYEELAQAEQRFRRALSTAARAGGEPN